MIKILHFIKQNENEPKKRKMANGEFKWENLLTIAQNDTIIITVRWESFCLAFIDKQKKVKMIGKLKELHS